MGLHGQEQAQGDMLDVPEDCELAASKEGVVMKEQTVKAKRGRPKMATESKYTFKQMCLTGTFFGMAMGLLVAITTHQPIWLDQPDYMFRCAVITAATFALIGLSIIPNIEDVNVE